MKKLLVSLLIAILLGVFLGYSSNNTREPELQEYITVVCQNCMGNRVVMTYWGPVYCPNCGGAGVVTVRNPNYNPSFQGRGNSGYYLGRCHRDCGCTEYKKMGPGDHRCENCYVNGCSANIHAHKWAYDN